MKITFSNKIIYILLLLVSVIFVISIWDKNLYFGGDIIFPLSPKDNILKIYSWLEENGGTLSYHSNLTFWYIFFYVFSVLGLSVVVTQKIFIIILLVTGFVFSYLLHKLLFRKTEFSGRLSSLLSSVVFTFNPIYLLLPNAYPSLSGFPVGLYFLCKFLESRNFIWSILFSLTVNFSFFADFPQPKLLIVFFISSIFMSVFFGYLRGVKRMDVFLNFLILWVINFILNAWVLVPYFFNIFFNGVFNYLSGSLTNYGADADYKIAAIPYISRFFNLNIVTGFPYLGTFLTGFVFVLFSFFLWAIILFSFKLVKSGRDLKMLLLLLAPVLFLIFLSKGANPPFGEAYRFFISRVPFSNIFRTTSSVIAGGVVFYSLLVSVSCYMASKKVKNLVPVIIIINILLFYPIYLGLKFYNISSILPLSDLTQKGFIIPKEYADIGKYLDKLPDDRNILVFPLDSGYVRKKWDYFGPPLINWVTKKHIVHTKTPFGLSSQGNGEYLLSHLDCNYLSVSNIGYVLEEKDTVDDRYFSSTAKYVGSVLGEVLVDNKFFKLYRVSNMCSGEKFNTSTNVYEVPGTLNNVFGILKNDIESSASAVILQESAKKLDDETFPLIIPAKNEISSDEAEIATRIRSESFIMPATKWPPDSFGYKFVRLYESFIEFQSRNDKVSLARLKAWHAKKRLSEIRFLIDSGKANNKELLTNLLKDFESRYSESIGIISELKRNEISLNVPHIELIEYLKSDFEKIKIQIGTKEYKSFFENMGEADLVKEIFSRLNTSISEFYFTFNEKILGFKVLIPINDNYELFLNNEAYEGTNDLVSGISIDGVNVLSKNIFLGAGEHKIQIELKGAENLIDDSKWNYFKPEIKDGDVTLNTPPISKDTNLSNVTWQKVQNYEPENIYLLKFDYKAQNVQGLIYITEENNANSERNIYDPILKANLEPSVSGGISHYEFVFKSNPGKSGASIILTATPQEDRSATADYKNVQLYKIIQPNVYLKSSSNTDPTFSRPKLEVKKLSPVKYILTLSKIDKPFFLTFNENFNQNWKIWEYRGNPFKFLLPDYIAQNNHYTANGFSNSWLISPKDIGQMRDVQLVVEYFPQRIFDLSLIISIGFLLLIITAELLKKLFR